MVGGLFPTEYYNGEPLPSDQLGKNVLQDSKLLGVPRIRQVKVENNSCAIPDAFDDMIFSCYAPYTESSEDTAIQMPSDPAKLGCSANYDTGTGCDNSTYNAWRFRSEGEPTLFLTLS